MALMTNVTRTHRWALALTAVLVAAFVAVTALNARYGYAFVLKTFEVSQLDRAEQSTGLRVEREYRDYLQVDPTSLLVRGLLINWLLDERRGADAVEVAQEGVEIANDADKPLAELLLARAKIGNGDLDEAEKIYQGVLSTVGESGEAHYGLAHIHAARGEFKPAWDSYAEYWHSLPQERMAPFVGSVFQTSISDVGCPVGCTPDFNDRVTAASNRITEDSVYLSRRGLLREWTRKEPSQFVSAGDFDAIRAEMLTGDLDSVVMIDWSSHRDSAPPDILFWLGVKWEERGNLDEARRDYRTAAEQGDPLAIAALERLGPAE
jgi:tetratricopeptide (TPR) repeat protein